MYWITKDRRQIELTAMTTEHLYNTLLVLKKKDAEIRELRSKYTVKLPPYRIHKYAISTWIKRISNELSTR